MVPVELIKSVKSGDVGSGILLCVPILVVSKLTL